MSNVVYCEFCKESFDIKKWTSHRDKCKKNPYTIIECRYCKKEFNQDKIQNHLIKCKKHYEKISKKNIFIKCEHCNKKVLKEYFVYHNSRCTKNPKNWNVNDSIVEDNNESSNIKILKDSFYPKKNNQKVNQYTGNNVYITNDDGSVEFLGKQEKTEVKLNKNKNILKSNDSYYNSTTKDNTAFSIRDNGKFGSMPLYDNYDEESNA